MAVPPPIKPKARLLFVYSYIYNQLYKILKEYVLLIVKNYHFHGEYSLMQQFCVKIYKRFVKTMCNVVIMKCLFGCILYCIDLPYREARQTSFSCFVSWRRLSTFSAKQ